MVKSISKMVDSEAKMSLKFEFLINPFEVTEFFQSKNALKNNSSGLENFSFGISEIIQPVAE